MRAGGLLAFAQIDVAARSLRRNAGGGGRLAAACTDRARTRGLVDEAGSANRSADGTTATASATASASGGSGEGRGGTRRSLRLGAWGARGRTRGAATARRRDRRPRLCAVDRRCAHSRITQQYRATHTRNKSERELSINLSACANAWARMYAHVCESVCVRASDRRREARATPIKREALVRPATSPSLLYAVDRRSSCWCVAAGIMDWFERYR